MKKLVVSVLMMILCTAIAARPARAQSRPLVTEDPETVPAGSLLVEGGLDFSKDTFYPLSGLRGRLLRIGTFGLSIGISSIAEIQLDGGLRDQLSIVTTDPTAPLAGMLTVVGTSTHDFEDLVIGTKVKIASETETRPAFAVRFYTRLPNASNENGLGSDTTDFHFNLAVAKTVQSIRVAGNFGFGILADATRGDRQNDVLDFGLSVARAVAPGAEIVGEMTGRLNTRSGTPPPGTDSAAIMRLGSRFTHGPVRADAAVLVGVTERDPSWGFSVGATWVFKAFTVK